MKKISIPIVLLLLLMGCSKEDDTAKKDAIATLRLQFQHVAKDTSGQRVNLVLDEMKYLNADADTFSVSTFKYYISNVKLFDAQGDSVVIPNSYYLIEQSSNKPSATPMKEIAGIPAVTYSKIQFSIGVDATHNNPDSSQYYVGELNGSGADGMPWVWAKGYKFLRLDGATKTDEGRSLGLVFHIGENENFQTIAFTNNITLQEGKTTMAHCMVLVHKLFTGTSDIDFDVNNDVQVKPANVASQVANNYETGMFMLHHHEILE